MLKKIYEELVTIRKELQAIRSSLESGEDSQNNQTYMKALENYVLADRAANLANTRGSDKSL